MQQRKDFRGSSARVVLAAAALLAAAAVFAQARPSLADRVARLEQSQAQAGSQNVELLNRITELQSEVQALRDQIETQAHTLQQLAERNRQQYLDLDGRLRRLESGPTPAAAGDAGSVAAVGDATDGGDADAAAVTPSATAGVVAPAEADAGTAIHDERNAYEQAFEALKNGHYADAARRFSVVLSNWPDGAFAPNAQYWLGESYYVTQNYQLASESFRALLARFPDSAKAPDALLKLGYCQYELKQFEQAQATLNQVIERYPDSTVARLAQGRLRAMLLERQ